MSLATLDGWIRSLESVKGDIAAAGPAIAKEIKAEVDAAVSSGRSVDGTAWAPTKQGTKPLRNAASAVSVRAIGSVLLLKLTGHHVFHHFGTGRLPRRPILPVKGLPPKLGLAIRAGLVENLSFLKRKKRRKR